MAYVEEKLDARDISSTTLDKEAEEKLSYIQQNETVQSANVSCTSSETTAQRESNPEKDLENGDAPQLPPIKHEEGPDGGYGWIVVMGAFCVQITSFGIVSSWGVMQDYFHQALFSDNPQALVDLSFVGTLALICINGGSPIVQVFVARYGLRPVMITGTFLITLGMEMAGFATEVWHLYLTQGILFGLGASCMYVTVMSVTPQWFTKHRGLALGIVAGGSGAGGLILPFIITSLNRSMGSGWTYRVLGFICLACGTMSCILVKERVPRPREKKKLSQIVQFDVLRNTNFLMFCIASDIALFGYFIPLFFVPAYATHLGMSDSQGSSLISVCSAMNFVGRLAAGYMADRIGRLNSNIIFHLLTAISCFLIWTFAYSFGPLMAFSTVYGFSCGAYFTLMSPISASLLGMEKFPSGLSLLLLFNAFPVFGANISSAIETAVTSEPFFTYKMFAGTAFLLGGLILIFLKLRVNKNPFVKI